MSQRTKSRDPNRIADVCSLIGPKCCFTLIRCYCGETSRANRVVGPIPIVPVRKVRLRFHRAALSLAKGLAVKQRTDCCTTRLFRIAHHLLLEVHRVNNRLSNRASLSYCAQIPASLSMMLSIGA